MDSDDLDLQRGRSPLRIKLRRGSLSCAPTISGRQPVGMVAQRRAIDRIDFMSQSSVAPAIAHNKPPEILSLIGDTPLVEVTQFDTGPCQLLLKLENQNPGGSIKDRIALSMIEAAETEGRLEPGGTVIEATAGNTGLGLALVAGAKGYRVLLVIPDKMSQEKISHVRALGAEVRITRSDVTRGHPE